MFSLNTLCVSLLAVLPAPSEPKNLKLYNCQLRRPTARGLCCSWTTLWIRRHQPPENNLIKWSVHTAGMPGLGAFTFTNLKAKAASFVISQDTDTKDWLALSRQYFDSSCVYVRRGYLSAGEGTFRVRAHLIFYASSDMADSTSERHESARGFRNSTLFAGLRQAE
ncbi:hypothetical protein C8F01DRAFT_1236969 [Mycena amicta]|nr:hypothetical protein C8F01DRAFT_1236969 [Mycena amicta]